MKKAILFLIFGAVFALAANSQNDLTESDKKQIADEVSSKIGIVISFDDILKSGGVLITTYGTTLPDKVVEVKLNDLVVVVLLKED